jgi:uracil-DNA glycosylase
LPDRRSDLAEHLRWFGELGVRGLSRDPGWRQRAAGPGAPARPEPAPPEPVLPEEVVAGGAPPASAAAQQGGVALQRIRTEIGDCTRCKLHRLGRRQVVFGVGNPQADLMFIGEGPGEEEDLRGEPFVGRAGQLLTKIIEAMGLTRDQVYIANVVKCRPPENRNPEADEIETCEPFLFAQIDAIAPKAIVALGTFAAQALLRTKDPISRLRGQVFEYRGAHLVPTFHPAYLLRSPHRKRDTWDDMKKVMALLAKKD